MPTVRSAAARLPGYANCIAFFAHLIAGPAGAPERDHPADCSGLRALGLQPDADREGLMIVLLGLAKKLVLADGFAPLADRGFDAAAAGASLTLLEAWYAVLAFSLQIYFDFSGYSDIAIGLARMFSIRFPLKLQQPVQGVDNPGFLATLEHHAEPFPARLPLYPPGRQPAWRGTAAASISCSPCCSAGYGMAPPGASCSGAGCTGSISSSIRCGSGAAPALAAAAATPGAGADTAGRAARLGAVSRAGHGGGRGHAARPRGLNGLALPAPLIALVPLLGNIARAVPVLPALGDARTLSLPEAPALLALGWFIVLACRICMRRRRGCARRACSQRAVSSSRRCSSRGWRQPFLYFRF